MQYMFSLPLSRHLENFEKYTLQNTAFFWKKQFFRALFDLYRLVVLASVDVSERLS